MQLDQLPEAGLELDGPAYPPPARVVPNFDHPDHYNASGYALFSTFLVIGTVAIFVRLYTQVFRLRCFHLEDFLGFAGYCMFVTLIGATIPMLVSPGFYVHQWDVRLRDMSRLLYINHIGACMYIVGMGTVKAAILLSWLRIFNPMRLSRLFLWTCHLVLWINVLYYFSMLLVLTFRCTPVAKKWDVTIIGGHCITDKVTYLGHPFFNLLSDIIILVLPQNVIWRLQIPRSKKVGISSLFGVSGVCCILIGCYRIDFIVDIPNRKDRIYEKAPATFLVLGEMVLVLLVFCIPTFPRALSRRNTKARIGTIELRSLRDVLGSRVHYRSWPRERVTLPHDDDLSSEDDIQFQPPVLVRNEVTFGRDARKSDQALEIDTTASRSSAT